MNQKLLIKAIRQSKFWANLVLGFAFFSSACTQMGSTVPEWHNPYKPSKKSYAQPIFVNEQTLDHVYMMVEEPASYPGGASAWANHIKNNLNYPIAASKRGITGKVFLSFDVTKEGELVNVSILKGLGYGFDKEATRLLINSGKWNPARQNGKVVNARSRLSIPFISVSNLR